MTPSQIFSIANGVALGCWVLLIVLPAKRWVNRTLAGVGVPALFAILYAAIMAVHFPASVGGFSTLADVALLFGNPWLLLAGWIHYLAFDLLAGSWEVRDARRRGISHLVVVLCLILTFLFGPAGWLLYMAIRRAHPYVARPSSTEFECGARS